MCGSRPLAEAVTRSTGTGAVMSGSAARMVSTRPWTALITSEFVGERFEPDDAPALYGNGLVADGRPQKYFASSKGCPMRAEPTALPSLTIRLPFFCRGNTACAMAVTIAGYASEQAWLRSSTPGGGIRESGRPA